MMYVVLLLGKQCRINNSESESVMYSNKVVLSLFCKSGVIVVFSRQAPRVHMGHICDPTKSP